jgi:uncharacterized membrane protein
LKNLRHYLPRLSLLSLTLGLIFVAASLTPSLVPRGPVLQGVLGGIVMAMGYFAGRIIEALWGFAAMPVLRGKALLAGRVLPVLGATGLVLWSLVYSLTWQNDLRERMGAAPATEAHLLRVVLLTLAVFAVLFVIGWAIALLSRFVRRKLDRIMPSRRADVLGILLVAVGLFILTREGLVDTVFDGLDKSFEAAQNLFDNAPPAPQDARFTGSPASLVDWRAIGQPGRNFVTTGPDSQDIAAFTGRPAMNPVRVYVGRANGDTPQQRAALALAELKRQGGFSRKVLIVTSPTGTGWMDPGAHDTVEYMHDGNIATVANQYSYLNSPLALVFETTAGLEQATATLALIHEYWKTLPKDKRPRLYANGLSLGAWSSMHATTLFRLVDDPIDGAFWAGPPFPSEFWRRAQNARNKGTPWVHPKIGDGALVRVAARDDDGAKGAARWGSMRIMFLQYPSDAIVFYEPASFFRAPVWMREPPGDGVSPYLRFMPVVTSLQLALDMAIATEAPPGFGHSYYARDYIRPWVQVTAPENWTEADTVRLMAHCDNGFANGCNNASVKAP